MLKIGEFNKLVVSRKKDFGYFLAVEENERLEEVLLPNNNILDKKNIQKGEVLDVFIYRDSKSRLVATQKIPFAKVGDTAVLKVVSNTDIGSFVDIGLDRDVFVPFREKKYKIFSDESYPFHLYLDKSGRICATLYVEDFLKNESNYKEEDIVSGYVVGFHSNKAAVLCVDGKYKAILPKSEYYIDLKMGDFVRNLKVLKKYEDGKMCLTLRGSRIDEMEEVEKSILNYMSGNDGYMRFNDKSDPEEIRIVFSTSKKGFKRSLGRLMKSGKIIQNENGCYMTDK